MATYLAAKKIFIGAAFLGLSAQSFGESVTAENVRKANAQAQKIFSAHPHLQQNIDEYFVARGLDPRQIPALDKSFHIRVLNEGCFNDTDIATNLYSKRSFEAVQEQILQAAIFLKNFHERARGQSFALFQPLVVEICTQAALNGQLMKYDDGVLKIGLPAGLKNFYQYAPLNAHRLMDLWDRGEFLREEKSWPQKLRAWVLPFLGQKKTLDAMLQKLWPVLNPIGRIRQGVRNLQAHLLKGKAARLTEARQAAGSGGNAEEQLRQQLFAQVLPEDFQRETGQNFEAFLKTLFPEQMTEILERWAQKLQSPELLGRVVEAAVAASGAEKDQRFYSNHQDAWIMIQNEHHIDIAAALSRLSPGGHYQRLMQRSSTAERSIIKINHQGPAGEGCRRALVAVSTHDTVEVDLNISLQKVTETAALLDVLIEMGLLQRVAPVVPGTI